MTDDVPHTFDLAAGRWRTPLAFRRWRDDQRDERIAALVAVMFRDAAHRGDRGQR